jgi:Predicted ATPases
MKKHIRNLKISSFRGIRELDISDLSDVNIFVGDNNSGKTSVLEAIQLINNPTFYNTVLVSREREKYRFRMGNLTQFESFMYLFPHNSDSFLESTQYSVRIDSTIGDDKEFIEITGFLDHQLIDWGKYPISKYKSSESLEKESEVLTFFGNLRSSFNDFYETIEINDYMSISRADSKEMRIFPMKKVGSVDHVAENSFKFILDNREFREQAIELLNEFEPNIKDLRYSEGNERRAIPIVETKTDSLPLSMYGDGMKRAIALLNALIPSESGVVLIDELETAIHTSAMDSVFSFILNSAKKLNVQLFITTHSLEAVDKLLENSGNNLERIRLIRLKNKSGKTYAKVLNGLEAKGYREKFDMELRI